MEKNKKTIAFRIWSHEDKKYIPNKDISKIAHAFELIQSSNPIDKNSFKLETSNEDYIIEQYLELWDIHNNQVCESDILNVKMHFQNCDTSLESILIVDNRFPGMIHPFVEYEKGKFLLFDMEKSLQAENLEIVGNIHEDPSAEKTIKRFKKRIIKNAEKTIKEFKRRIDGI